MLDIGQRELYIRLSLIKRNIAKRIQKSMTLFHIAAEKLKKDEKDKPLPPKTFKSLKGALKIERMVIYLILL